MTQSEITTLLEKYWDGETSLSEEQSLKHYFAAGEVDERFAQYAPLFAAIRAEQNIEIPAAPAQRPAQRRIYWYAAAASIVGLLAVGVWWANKLQNDAIAARTQEKLYQDTYDDPQKAVAEIKAALALVSSKMRKGKKEAAKGLNKMTTVDKYMLKPKVKKFN